MSVKVPGSDVGLGARDDGHRVLPCRSAWSCGRSGARRSISCSRRPASPAAAPRPSPTAFAQGAGKPCPSSNAHSAIASARPSRPSMGLMRCCLRQPSPTRPSTRAPAPSPISTDRPGAWSTASNTATGWSSPRRWARGWRAPATRCSPTPDVLVPVPPAPGTPHGTALQPVGPSRAGDLRRLRGPRRHRGAPPGQSEPTPSRPDADATRPQRARCVQDRAGAGPRDRGPRRGPRRRRHDVGRDGQCRGTGVAPRRRARVDVLVFAQVVTGW